METTKLSRVRLKSDLKHNSDWPSEVLFTCYACDDNSEIDGVEASISHMQECHSDEFDVEKPAACIACPKKFSKINQLWSHIWKLHLIPISPDLPSSPPSSKRRKRVKSELEMVAESGSEDDDTLLDYQIRLKCEPDQFPEGSDWSTQTVFNCFICGSETDGFRSSVDHVRQSHSETITRDKNAPCIVCPKLFARMDHLKKHVWSHVNHVFPGVPPHFVSNAAIEPKAKVKLEKTSFGDEEIIDDSAIANLIRFKLDPDDFPDGVDWSTQTLFNCYLCAAEIDGFRDSVKHVRTAHSETLQEERACPCIVCPKRFGRMDHLKNHVFSHVNKVRPGIAKHNISTFVRSATSRASLKHRLFGNSDEFEFEDEEDDEEFDQYVTSNGISEMGLIELKSNLHCEDSEMPSDADWSSKTFIACRICHKQCDGFHMAVSHMKHIHPRYIDSNEEQSEQELCPICPKAFRKIDCLKNHVWRHVNRLYPGTPRHAEMISNALGRGKPSWTEEREWPCKRCDKSIKGITEFVEHLDTMHPNQCGIVCPLCDKELPSKRRLKIHVVIHSDKKATCPHCGKAFSEAYKLRRHLREVHDNVKEHICSTCGKSFARADKLFQHELVHVNKTDSRVEWVPIMSDKMGPSTAASTSDESSDSSSDNDEGSLSSNEALDDLLNTSSIKEEADDPFHEFFHNVSEMSDEPDWSSNCSLNCFKCGAVTSGFAESVLHMQKVHGGSSESESCKAFQCIQCPKSFGKRELLKNHIRRHVFVGANGSSPQNYWSCKRCPDCKPMLGISSYINHLDDFHPSECELPCPVCDQMLPDVAKLKSHLSDRHSSKVNDDSNSDCLNEESGFDFEMSDEDFEVQRKKLRGRPAKKKRKKMEDFNEGFDTIVFKCCECGDLVEGIEASVEHMSVSHPSDGKNGKYACLRCSSLFARKAILVKHLKNHAKHDEEDGHEDDFVDSKTAAILDFRDPLQDQSVRSTRILENKHILMEIDETHWGKEISLTCHLCEHMCSSVHSAYDHMLQNHAVEFEKPQCVLCHLTVINLVQFKIHTWRHFNAFTPKEAMTTECWTDRVTWKCKQCSDQLSGISSFIEHAKAAHQNSVSGLECPTCERKDFDSKSLLVEHIVSHNTDQSGKPCCQLCGKSFFNRNKLRRHVMEVHEGRKNHMCSECGKFFARPDKLRSHEKVHSKRRKIKAEDPEDTDEFGDEETEEDPIESDYSEEKGPNEDLEAFNCRKEMHMKILDSVKAVDMDTGQSWHQKATFSCRQCQTLVQSVDNARQHMSECHPRMDGQLGCILCHKSLPSLDALMIHLWRHLKKAVSSSSNFMENQMWKCNTCGDSMIGVKAFFSHQKISHGITDMICPGCDKSGFTTKAAFRKHFKVDHGIRMPCDFCGKFFSDGHKMKRHIQEVHEMRKTFVCKECGKGFSRSERLKYHMEIHVNASLGGNKPFLCHQCGRGFGRQEHVARHQKICGKRKSKCRLRLRDEAPIPDDEIEKIATELGIHNNLNESDEKTPCKFCERSFRNKRYMIEHYVRNHREANQKLPHRCEVCGRGFKVIRDLERHMKRPNTKYFHSEEYLRLKFVCSEDGCCRRFKKERSLAKHMLIHSNIRNYKCDRCTQAFCTRQTLRAHVKYAHQVILPTETKKGKKLGPRKVKPTDKEAASPKPSGNNESWDAGANQAPSYFTTIQANNQLNLTQWLGMEQKPAASSQKLATFPIEVREQDNISVDDQVSLPSSSQPEYHILVQTEESEALMKQDQVLAQRSAFKKRMPQPLLNDEQKQLVAEEMSGANLGPLCTVCGKIFKSKDALDFHIMYTKLPGHDVLQRQKLKNTYAQEAMRVSAKLQMESIDMPEDYGPPTPIVAASDDQPPTPMDVVQEVFDAKTGVFVKAEIKSEPMPPPRVIISQPSKPSLDSKTIKSKSKIFKCMECHRGFKREIKLIKHVGKKHSKMMRSNASFEAKRAQHVEGALKLTPLGCPDCTLVFSSEEAMMNHFNLPPHAGQSQPSKCPVLTCDMSFANRSKLVEHLMIGKHGQPCPQCGKTFTKLDNLELHVRSHWTERPFQCEHCDKSYKDSPSLYSHIQTHHGAKRSHLCSECGASFMKSDHLKRHINSTHRKIKTIKCNFCDMMFSDKYKAKIHERKHTGESPYMCDICSKTFKRKEALDNHAIVHKDLPKDFKCVTCGAAFNSQQYLNRHISRHFAEKKHKCRDCEMAFIDKRDYIVHVSKVHANHRPFGCSTCGMAYKTKQGLTSHLKSHPDGDCVNNANKSRGPSKADDVKPFACTDCDKKYAKKHRLDAHIKSHHPELASNEEQDKAFGCPMESCLRVFDTAANLKAHMEQHEANQTFVLKPAAVAGPTDPNYLPTSLQQALSQHQKVAGIPQVFHHPHHSNMYQAQVLPYNIQPHHQQQQQQQQVVIQQDGGNLSGFYQHYFNQSMYKQS